jgi:DNA-binding GntR family transcriptional regulator
MTRPDPQQFSNAAVGTELDPIRRTTQSMVAERVRIEILSGSLSPGSRLMQADLAKRMNTSTTPVREALRELASEGLLHLDPHRGVIVHEPSEEELAEIYQIRRLLEPESVVKTVENITEAEIERARELTTRMENEKDPGTWTVLNNQFHAILAQASRSPLLASIVQNLRNRSSQYVASSMRNLSNRIDEANREHAELLLACIDQDPDTAIAITRQHLEATVDHGASHLS